MGETGLTIDVASHLISRIKPISPPPTHHMGWKCALKVGMPVVAKWKRGFKMWSAKIVAVNGNGTFSLHYDDGDKDPRVPRASICAKNPPAAKPTPVPKISPALIATVPKFAVGAIIEARWKGGSKYYRGKIVKVNPDGTYAIHHDDGDKASSVVAAHIRPVRPPKKKIPSVLRGKPSVSRNTPKSNPVAKKLSAGTPLRVGFKVRRNGREAYIKEVHGDNDFDIEYYDGVVQCNLTALDFTVLTRVVGGRTEPQIDAAAEETHNKVILASRMAILAKQIDKSKQKQPGWRNLFGLF